MILVFIFIFVFILCLFIFSWIQGRVNKTDNSLFISLKFLEKKRRIKKNGLGIIDHIYILNLEKNLQKKQVITEEVQEKLKFKLTKDNFFSAFYGKSIANSVSSLVSEGILASTQAHSFFNKILYKDRLKSPGQLGHYISFYQIFCNAIAHKFEFFMVLEDDAIIDSNLLKNLNSILDGLRKSNCSYVSLGQADYFYQQNKNLLKSSSYLFKLSLNRFYLVSKSKGLFRQTHAMIFRTEKIMPLMKNYFPMYWPTDVALGHWSRSYLPKSLKKSQRNLFSKESKLEGMFCYPPLVRQNDCYKSDIDHWMDIDLKKMTRVKAESKVTTSNPN